MCLDEKTKFRVRKENGYFVAWKIFKPARGGGLKPLHFNYDKIIKQNIWYQSKQEEIECFFLLDNCIDTYLDRPLKKLHSTYLTGFHCYKKLIDAQIQSKRELLHPRLVIAKVYLKEILATGKQSNSDVIVAKHMMVGKKIGVNKKT